MLGIVTQYPHKSSKPKRGGRSVKQALEKIRVIDFTSHISGPFCTMLLADMGADVVKIERPGCGDNMRHTPPLISGESAAFMQINRNKRSIALDLKAEKDLEICRQLCDNADVVVENFRPGTLERLGLGYDRLQARNPRLIYCSISGFGQTGPYRGRGGFDLMAQAMSGLMSICGNVDGPPMRLPIAISDMCGGMYASIGVLSALNARQTTGAGQQVDTSLFEAAMSFSVYEAASFNSTGEAPRRLGQAHRGAAPYQVFKTRDGWITIGAATQKLWARLCDVLDADNLLHDERFLDNPNRVVNHLELAEELTPYFVKEDTAHWEQALLEVGIPVGPVRTYDEVFINEHTVAREMFTPMEHPAAGMQNLLGIPVKLSTTPGAMRRPAPRLGEHSDEILAELGNSSSD